METRACSEGTSVLVERQVVWNEVPGTRITLIDIPLVIPSGQTGPPVKSLHSLQNNHYQD